MTHVTEQKPKKFSGYLESTKLLDKLSGFLFGDDIFISYSHRDALNYAPALARVLAREKFVGYLDQYGTDAEDTLPPALVRRLRRSTVLVLVGTEGAAQSDAVKKEVEIFRATGRSIIPIDVGGALTRAEWVEIVKGVPVSEDAAGASLPPVSQDTADAPILKISEEQLIEETEERRQSAEPSPLVVSRVVNSFKYTKRTRRQRLMFLAAFVLLLASFGVAASSVNAYLDATLLAAQAEQQAQTAQDTADKAALEAQAAEVQKLQAQRDRDSAKTDADQAVFDKKLADEQAAQAENRENLAKKREAQATANATQKENIALSRAKATFASRIADEEPDRALIESVNAFRIHPTVEARSSLLGNLELYSNLISTVRQHNNTIINIASCFKGKVLVSADDTGQIVFRDLERNRIIERPQTPRGDYRVAVACADKPSPDSSVCAAVYVDDDKLIIWDIEARGEEYAVTPRQPLSFSMGSIVPLAFVTPELLAAVIGEGEVALLDLGQDKPQPEIKMMPGRSGWATLAVHPDKKTLAIGFYFGITLWKIGEPVENAKWLPLPKELLGTQYRTKSLSFSADGNYLAVTVEGSDDLSLWDLSKLNPVGESQPDGEIIKDAGDDIAFFESKYGQRLVTTKKTGEITLWAVPFIHQIWKKPFKPGVSSMAVINRTEGVMVATGSDDGLLAFWAMDEKPPLRQDLADAIYPSKVYFGRSSGMLYSESLISAGHKLWKRAGDGYEPLQLNDISHKFQAGEFGQSVNTIDFSNVIRIVDVLSSQSKEINLSINHGPYAPTAVRHDRQRLAIAQDGSIAIWDISDSTRPKMLYHLDSGWRPTALAFGTDNRTLVAGYDNGRVILWDANKRTKRNTLISSTTRHPGSSRRKDVDSVALSPDGKLVAASSTSDAIILWDTETGLLLGQLGRGEWGRINSMTFSHDGKRLAAAVAGGPVYVWNLDPRAWATMALQISNRK